jgi:SAM-dependent methyltransferase
VDLKEVHLLGDEQETHWYYAAKSAALLGCLDGREARHVLDVGAGNGFFARALLKHAAAEAATCVDPGYAADWSEPCAGKLLEFRQRAGAGDADLIVLMDVLEHVDDDLALLREYVESARPGTHFVFSVPACAWLWSPHDEFLGHRRRYTLPMLTALLRAAGLRPVTGFYFFGLVFPVAAVRRLWQRVAGSGAPASDLRRHHPWLNAALRRVCLAEARIARWNRAFGLTAFALAVKPGEGEVQR